MIKDLLKNNSVTIVEYAVSNMKDMFESPFNMVDSLILAQLSYLQLQSLVPTVDADKPWLPISSLYKAEYFEEMFNVAWNPEGNRELLTAVAASPRYRDILVNFFVNNIDPVQEKQFAAITFLLPTGESYVSFRGTDATMVGWKEDFNMMFTSPVPSQISAVKYLEYVANRTAQKIYVGGHSKGGNLAIYAAAYVSDEIQDRIVRVDALDAPGFIPEFLAYDGYKRIENKINNIIPEGSIVGIIFETIGEHKIIKSERLSVMQHDPFSWEITGDDFLYTENFKSSVKFMDKTLNNWIYSLSDEQRKTFIDTMFSIIYASGTETLGDFAKNAIKEADTIKNVIKNIDEETATCIKLVIKELVKVSVKSVFSNEDAEIIKKQAETFS